MPPAPARFSITTGWPSASLMRFPPARASTSGTPPAVVGTITRIGRVGNVGCAKALAATRTSAAVSQRMGDMVKVRHERDRPRGHGPPQVLYEKRPGAPDPGCR